MSLERKLKELVPEHDVLVTKADTAYARLDQATNVAESWPLMVVRVNTVEELIDVVQCCIKERTPLVVRGAGTGKSGGAVADAKTVVIDVARLQRIMLIDDDNLLAEVEPGVVLADLQEAVMKRGLFYPPDPASRATCTLGGNVAENAAGPSTLKYGTTREYLLGGQAILGTGEVIDFGKRCPKGVTGFDIASLLCGSEGTLAVFTKLVLRLIPLPKSYDTAMIYFSDEASCLAAVSAILRQGHLPKTLEYIDDMCLRALRALLQFVVPAKAAAALIIECDASFEGGAEKQRVAICEMLVQHGMIHVDVAEDDRARCDLWARRARMSEACTHFRGFKLSEDIAVPLGAIAEFGRTVKTLSPDPAVSVGIFGHAGDGNLHVQIMFADERYLLLAQQVRHEILLLVLSLRGTLTAEHGIGLQKKGYLHLEQAPALIDLQKRIKVAFDPHYLLNPGKIFDR